MMPKFKVIIRKEKTSKITNEAPVCLRITKDRQSAYKTIVSVKPEFFDEKNQCIKKSYPNAEILNAKITETKAKIQADILLLNTAQNSIGVNEIRNKIKGNFSLNVFEYSESYLVDLYLNGNYSTYKKCKSVIYKLKNYTQTESLLISSITSEFLKKYENYLSTKLNNNQNTITVNMKVLSKIVGDIYSKYNFDESVNPFKKYKFKKEESCRGFLEESELQRILDLKFNRISPLFDAREVFLIECFSGMRISDILTLKWKHYDGTNFNIQIRKTEKSVVIPVSETIKSIIEKRRNVILNNKVQPSSNDYIFNILRIDVEKSSKQDALNAISSATAVINKKLKRIATKASIEKNVTTHVGRHTFATLLLTKGAGIYDVQELLGHHDVKITQVYANMVDNRRKYAIDLIKM